MVKKTQQLVAGAQRKPRPKTRMERIAIGKRISAERAALHARVVAREKQLRKRERLLTLKSKEHKSREKVTPKAGKDIPTNTEGRSEKNEREQEEADPVGGNQRGVKDDDLRDYDDGDDEEEDNDLDGSNQELDPLETVELPKKEGDKSLQDAGETSHQLIERLVNALVEKRTPPENREKEEKPLKTDLKITTMNYSGSPTDNLDLYLWQNEQMFEAKGVPKKLRVVISISSLRGKALEHMQSLGTKCQELTWEDYKEHLKQVFSPIQEKEKALERIASLQQTRDLVTYHTEFHTLLNKLTIPAELQILFYLKGLKTRTQAEVRVKKPETLDAAMKIAELYEGAMFGNSARTHFENKANHKKSNWSRNNRSQWTDSRSVMSKIEDKVREANVTQRFPSSRMGAFPRIRFRPSGFGSGGFRSGGNGNFRPNKGGFQRSRFRGQFRQEKRAPLKWTTDGKPICHKCNTPGHVAKDCFKTPKVNSVAKTNPTRGAPRQPRVNSIEDRSPLN